MMLVVLYKLFSTGNSDYIPVEPVGTFEGHRLRFRRNKVDPRIEDVLNITIINDDVGEPTEIFEIFLLQVRRNAYVTKPIGTVTIFDDDACKSQYNKTNKQYDGI